jgi:hypothetical protein
VLFAANANVITDISPILTLVAGVMLAGSVHTTKMVARPFITASTGGTGNWVVSIVEDIVAFFTSILALILPIITGILAAVALFFAVRLYRRRKKKEGIVFH